MELFFNGSNILESFICNTLPYATLLVCKDFDNIAKLLFFFLTSK